MMTEYQVQIEAEVDVTVTLFAEDGGLSLSIQIGLDPNEKISIPLKDVDLHVVGNEEDDPTAHKALAKKDLDALAQRIDEWKW